MCNLSTLNVKAFVWDDSDEAIEKLLEMFDDQTLHIDYRQDDPTCTIALDSGRSITAEIGDYIGKYNGIPVVIKMLKGDVQWTQ